ncbi:Spo11/DNA topoisomerase VI subunit A [Phaeosphaeriaceae sp. PMI808]|nr:Spo11/DNA topoisomerase VI subunit A [Phaeosphaeriaceae sp. PMI808]
MDAEFEDMLFGLATSPNAFEDITRHGELDSEEDIEMVLWDLEASPLLMPTFADEQADELIDSGESVLLLSRNNTTRATAPARDRAWVISQIEAMLERIVDGLLEEHEALTITLKSRVGISRRRKYAADNEKQIPVPKERNINFPGATAQEAWNFTVLLRILELVHNGLVDNTISTKRDLFYRHPDLFVKQSVVDRYVDDLACTFGVSRSQLNLTAAAKGLVAGNFNITRKGGYRIDGLKDQEGLFVPKIGPDDTLDLKSIQWVLVIEKEATFRSILSSAQWVNLGSRGLILTAKGYPDISSRAFLRCIAERVPDVPMHALVDFDPDGIAILSTYKYGSYRLAHEQVSPKDEYGLSLPKICWLGLKSCHVSQSQVEQSDTDTSTVPELQGLMKLTARDRTKAVRTLEWNICGEDGAEQVWRQELQNMLMLNVKAEMQILDERPNGLVTWLSTALGKAGEQNLRPTIDYACSEDGMLY